MKSTRTGKQRRRSKQAEIFDWQIYDDNEWRTSQQDTQMVTSTITGLRPVPIWRRWWLVLVAVTLLLLAVGVRWMQAQQELVTIESEVHSAMEIESQVINTAVMDHPMARQEFVPAGVQDIEIVELGNGWARVRVTVQKEDGVNYRQTRVYRPLAQQSAEWEQVAPSGRYWGRPRQWESVYFRFHYYAQDEEAVKAAAPKLDALYPTFYAALFAGDPASQKVTVVIDPAASIVSQSGTTRVQDASLTLPSPSATLAPLDVSEEMLLVQGVALALFDRLAVQSDTLNQLSTATGANYLRSGLRLWLFWDQELPLARWREPLVRWVFSADEVVPIAEKNVRVPAFAHDFCAYHRLWLSSVAEIDAPIACIQHVTGKEVFIAHRYAPPPMTMPYFIGRENLLARKSGNVIADPPLPMASAVAFATLFEFVSTNAGAWRNGPEPEHAGREGAKSVRVLINALSHYQNWNTLLPALFGVSRNEFETGLNNFLMERYGVAP